MKRIDQGQQLAAVWWHSRVFAVIEAAFDLGYSPVVVGGDRAVVQPGMAQRRVDKLVAQEFLDRRHPAAGVQKLRAARR
jgi:hypothetical protein